MPIDVYKRQLGYCADLVQSWEDSRHGHYSFCNLSQTVNISHGEVCGATPDGRLAGETYCDNCSPTMGRDLMGPTATVKSVASIDQGRFHDGALFNLRFDPKGIQGEKGLDIIEGVIKTYFEEGGEHIQINVVDDKTPVSYTHLDVYKRQEEDLLKRDAKYPLLIGNRQEFVF